MIVRFAWFANLILPGTGLILRRREWLGIAVCVLYGVLGHLVMAGWLVAPEGVPGWLSWPALAMLLMVWSGSQWLLRQHCRGEESRAKHWPSDIEI